MCLILRVALFVGIGICNITQLHYTKFPYYTTTFKDLVIIKNVMSLHALFFNFEFFLIVVRMK